MAETTLKDALKKLPRLRIAVIGDLVLDHYLWGDTSRISPEAPVGVVKIKDETFFPGTAGNVSRNITSLGANAFLFGVVGKDDKGRTLLSRFKKYGINAEGVVVSTCRKTTSKSRIISAGQQMLRVDREDDYPLQKEEERLLLQKLNALFRKKIHGIILSDYAKGVLTPLVLERIMNKAKSRNIPVITDPKARDYSRYRGTDIIKPNRKEAELETGIQTSTTEGLLCACRKIKSSTRCSHVIVSLGSDGLFLSSGGKKGIHLPAQAREVYDVSGAGDTVVATIILCLCSGMSLNKSCETANIAAGIVVNKIGAASVTPDELLEESLFETSPAGKIMNSEETIRIAVEVRSSGKRVVFTNGCFDLIHAGHIKYLQAARKLGDYLIVAINSDRSIRAIKGKDRPFIKENNRAHVIASLECVDCVTVFDRDTPTFLIREMRPDVLVKGGDYSVDQVVGKEVVEAYGGTVTVVPPVPGLSTTSIAQTIQTSIKRTKIYR